MPKKSKIIAFLLSFCLIFEQSGFAQSLAALDISSRLSSFHSSLIQDKFRPLHLRSLGYDNSQNNFRLLLDKGDLNNPKPEELETTTKALLNYFFVGVSLANEAFWVNLRPDSENNIIDPDLALTDVGKILLDADLALKKDTALATSPQTPEGKQYWDKLYQKAGELFGNENITIPTLTRPWIVPGEIIIRETKDNGYIYKATLKVMLEQDYLKNSNTYNFSDPRLKALNEYSSQLIRELIIPKLTKEVNTAQRYASLRQVYYSLILAQWFKARFYGKGGLYSWLINKKNLQGLTSKTPWSKTTYFNSYQKSFKNGEYNIQQPISTNYGQTIRSYLSGGAVFNLAIPTREPVPGTPTVTTQGPTTISDISGELASSPLTNNNLSALVIGSRNTLEINNVKIITGEASSPALSKAGVSSRAEGPLGLPAERPPQSGASSVSSPANSSPDNKQNKKQPQPAASSPIYLSARIYYAYINLHIEFILPFLDKMPNGQEVTKRLVETGTLPSFYVLATTLKKNGMSENDIGYILAPLATMPNVLAEIRQASHTNLVLAGLSLVQYLPGLSYLSLTQNFSQELRQDYRNNPVLLYIRDLLAQGDYARLKAYLSQSSINQDQLQKQLIAAILLNKQNIIISQTTDLIQEYAGNKGILEGLVPLSDKIGESYFTFEDLKSILRYITDISTWDIPALLSQQEIPFKIYKDKQGRELIVPISLEIILSAYRGSAETDHAQANYLTHALTTAIIHYATKGGERKEDPETSPFGANAFHEFDLGLMMLELRNNRLVDEDVSLAFHYNGDPLPEYARKRTVVLEGNTIAGHIGQLLSWQFNERRAKQNIHNIFNWIIQGALSSEQFNQAIERLKEEVEILRNQCGLKDAYFEAVFGHLDKAFFTSLQARYSSDQIKSKMLVNLFREAMQRHPVLKTAARNGTVKEEKTEHPWLVHNKTLLDYLQNEADIRSGTFEEGDISTVRLENLSSSPVLSGGANKNIVSSQVENKSLENIITVAVKDSLPSVNYRVLSTGSTSRGTNIPDGKPDYDFIVFLHGKDVNDATIEGIKTELIEQFREKGYEVLNMRSGRRNGQGILITSSLKSVQGNALQVQITIGNDIGEKLYVQWYDGQMEQVRALGADTEKIRKDIVLMKKLFKNILHCYEREYGGMDGIGIEQLILQSAGAQDSGRVIKGIGSFDLAMRWIYKIGYDSQTGRIRDLDAVSNTNTVFDPEKEENLLKRMNPMSWKRLVNAARKYVEAKLNPITEDNLSGLNYTLKDALSYRDNITWGIKIRISMSYYSLVQFLDKLMPEFSNKDLEIIDKDTFFLFSKESDQKQIKQSLKASGITIEESEETASSPVPMTRRDFIKGGVLALAASLLLGGTEEGAGAVENSRLEKVLQGNNLNLFAKKNLRGLFRKLSLRAKQDFCDLLTETKLPVSEVQLLSLLVKKHNPRLSNRDIYRVVYEILLAAKNLGVPVAYLVAVVLQESDGNPNAVGSRGRYIGAGQFDKQTWDTYFGYAQEKYKLLLRETSNRRSLKQNLILIAVYVKEFAERHNTAIGKSTLVRARLAYRGLFRKFSRLSLKEIIMLGRDAAAVYHTMEFLEAITVKSGIGLAKSSSPVEIQNGNIKENINSPAEKPGGIDFRSLPIINQPINTAMLKLSPADLTRLSNLNLNSEWAQIENMLNAGIIPSNQRIKEYVLASCLSKGLSNQMDKLLGCIADILRMEEDRVSQTEPELRDMLVLLEAGKPESELELGLAQIKISPKDPQVVRP